MIMVFIKRTFGDIRGVVGNSSGQIRFLSFFLDKSVLCAWGISNERTIIDG